MDFGTWVTGGRSSGGVREDTEVLGACFGG